MTVKRILWSDLAMLLGISRGEYLDIIKNGADGLMAKRVTEAISKLKKRRTS